MNNQQNIDNLFNTAISLFGSTLRSSLPVENMSGQDLLNQAVQELVTEIKEELRKNLLVGTTTLNISKVNKKVVSGALEVLRKDGLSVEIENDAMTVSF